MRSEGAEPAITRVRWAECWRVFGTRHMKRRVLAKLVDTPEEVEALEALDGLTNDRLRHERGELSILLPEDRACEAAKNVFVMKAFSTRSPSRFCDGSYGVYYAAETLDTAIAEAKHHAEKFMRDTAQPPMELQKRALTAALDGKLHDIRGMARKLADVYDPDDYAASQALARRLVDSRSYGLAYDSVRDKGGRCVAVFRPPVLSGCAPKRDLIFEWDGTAVARVRFVEDYRAKRR